MTYNVFGGTINLALSILLLLLLLLITTTSTTTTTTISTKADGKITIADCQSISQDTVTN